MRYTVITYPDVDLLIQEVNRHIAMNWQPSDGVIRSDNLWAQAMTWDDPKGWIDLDVPMVTQKIDPSLTIEKIEQWKLPREEKKTRPIPRSYAKKAKGL